MFLFLFKHSAKSQILTVIKFIHCQLVFFSSSLFQWLDDECCPSVSHCVSPLSHHPLRSLFPLPLRLAPLPCFANCSSKSSPSLSSVSVCSCLIPFSLRGAPLAYRCLTEAPFWRTPFHLLFLLYPCVCVCLCVCAHKRYECVSWQTVWIAVSVSLSDDFLSDSWLNFALITLLVISSTVTLSVCLHRAGV